MDDHSSDIIGIKMDKDRLIAKLYLKDDQAKITSLEEMEIIELIKEKGITFGLVDWAQTNWKEQLSKYSELLIAKGTHPINGTDAKLIIKQSTDDVMDEIDRQNFRDVTKIPMVEENDILAQIIPETEGEPGIDVYNKPVKQKKGNSLKYKAGKNVVYIEKEHIFKSTAAGQLSIGNQVINVYPLYKVDGELTLKTGNINFNGSVTIKGNVPTGYQVKAEGNIVIYGIVEAAYLDAGGNIYIKEGIAGMDKAVIQAYSNVEASYINQADVTAGGDIKVRKSIMNSICVAQGDINCKQGVIIGGSSSSGQRIEVKDLGNIANSKTELAFGINKKIMERVKDLKKEQDSLLVNKQKLIMLGNQLQQKKEMVGELLPKERVTLLKQRNLYEKISLQLHDVNKELYSLQYEIGNYTSMELIVRGKSYENVHLTFGKYKRTLRQEYKRYQANLKDKEIIIQPL